MKRIVMLVAAGAALAACAKEQPEKDDSARDTTTVVAAPTVPAEVQTAVDVKRGIDANPGKADSVLASHKLTAAGFDSLMYKISADSAMRAAYDAAVR